MNCEPAFDSLSSARCPATEAKNYEKNIFWMFYDIL